VDDWADNRYRNNTKLPAKSFENKPLSGFKLGKNVRHGGSGWGQGNVKWRIEDPRGFELEISSPNLSAILEFCTLENGEILQPCLWGRLRSENILVPVNSDVYEAAQANTARVAKKASLKDLKPGYTFVMQNGEEGLFLGNFYPLLSPSYSGGDRTPTWGTSKRAYYICKNGANFDGNLDCKASLKLSEITEGPELTVAEGEAKVNALLAQRAIYDPGPDSQKALAVSFGNPKDQAIILKRVDKSFSDMLAFSAKTSYGRWDDANFSGYGEVHIMEASGGPSTKFLLVYGIGQLRNQLDQRATILAAIAAGRSGYRPDTYDSMGAYVISESELAENRITYARNTVQRSYYNSHNEWRHVNVKLEIFEKTMQHFVVELTTQTADGTTIQLYV
jgi:hypothetical protein